MGDFDTCKQTYATLVDDFYFPGVVALKASMDRVGAGPLVCLCLPMDSAKKRRLESMGIECIDCDVIPNPNDDFDKRFSKIYSKLSVFRLVEYEKVIFIDADILLLGNIDELFRIDSDFAAAPDHGFSRNSDRLNSGLFLLKPSMKTFDDMMEKFSEVGSYDGSDQGFLNQYFEDRWLSLDPSFNTLKRVFEVDRDGFDLKKIKVLHFVGKKPWQFDVEENRKYKELNMLWYNYCPADILAEYLLADFCSWIEREENRRQSKEEEVDRQLSDLKGDVRKLEAEAVVRSQECEQLHKDLRRVKEEKGRILSSVGYKIGRLISSPFRKIGRKDRSR